MPAAPAAPGALGQPPAAREVLDYLAAMNAWTGRLRAALDDVDARARLGGSDPVLTGDITLAYALGQSIVTRVDEVSGIWDGGRVGAAELDEIARLLWSRLDGSGGLQVSLTEACTLAEALLARLTQRLARDPARSGAALRATAVRDALARCRTQAAELGLDNAARRAHRIAADLDQAVGVADPKAAAAAIARADAAASTLERDLIVESATRTSRTRVREGLDARLRVAVRRAGEVRALAARCATEVATPPVLAVPDPVRLGPVPEDDAEVEAYAARLDRVEAALREAAGRHGAPIAELAELRGLLDAYRAKAAAVAPAGPALAAAYDAAVAVLAARPCNVAEARERVASYRRAVDSGEYARTAREPTTARRKGGQR